MTQATLGKRWANIVSLFEQAEKMQRQHNAETVAAGCEVDDYNEGRLRVLELGVAHAKNYHRSFRFKFWLKPTISENQILVSFLLSLHSLTTTEEFADKSYRAGMTTALENWINWIAMDDDEAHGVTNWVWLPGVAL